MGHATYDFSDETAIVTGGSSGIGRAIALGLGAAGATVLVADITADPREPDATHTHEVIRDDGGDAEFVETDVSDPDEVAAVVEAARDYGGVDVMVNNAGIMERDHILDVTPESYDRVLSVNARGVFFGCKHAAADMVEREEPGTIVNTASINAELAWFDHPHYDASKGAVLMTTRSAALQLAEHDIRVNAVAPGVVPTQLSRGGPEAAEEAIASGDLPKPIPQGRGGDAAEVADAALFLASDAASYVTGELLHVDGGFHII
jgi:NAD(P)-dependent dehydrogenase (short-subunit alcohol dehydrogenase family)